MNDKEFVESESFSALSNEETAQIKEFEVILLSLNCSYNMLKSFHLEAENYGRKNLMFIQGMVREIKEPMDEVVRISQYMKEREFLSLHSGMLKKTTKSGYDLLELIDEVLDIIIAD